MKKNNKTTLFTLLIILITIIALIATSGTYAKYTSHVEATATAKVAKWEVTANDIDMADSTQTFTFNIFDTINDSNLTNGETDVQQPNSGAKVIAPGTSGVKDLKIINSSDVNIDISVVFDKSSTSPNLPIKFALVSSTTTPTASDFYSSSDFSKYLAGTLKDTNNDLIPLNVDTSVAIGATNNYKLYWIWEYDVNETQDSSDTNFGVQSAGGTLNQYNVTITVTATQKD